MNIKLWLGFFLLAYSSTAVSFTNWYDNLLFKDKSFTYEFTRTIGYTYTNGADVGECINTARYIEDSNTQSWYSEWLHQAKRIYHLADVFHQEKNLTSAQELYFRASNYFRTASFYLNSPDKRALGIATWEQSRIAFLKAITHIPYIRTVSIPYEKTTLPGYFISTKANNAPLLIVNTGFDGTAEELYFAVGLAGHRRGYNVLLIEGPGQGEVLRQQNLPFRPDWEKVITPIIDFSNRLPGINHEKVALIGLSMGGYLAARAAAFEPRIKAVILNGGVYDMSQSILSTLPKSVVKLSKNNPPEFNKAIQQVMNQDVTANWFFNNAMWVFHVNSPVEVLKTMTQYSIANFIAQIKCPTLVVDSTADVFFKGQPQLVYQHLKAPKTLLVFTPEEAAQAHCQVGAIAISNERIFNWLDNALGWHPLMIN